jgi:hypothetical protein
MKIIKSLTVITKARKQYPCDGYEYLFDTPVNMSEEQEFRFGQLPEVVLKGEEYYYLKEKTDTGMQGRKVNQEVYKFLLELNLITFI